MQVVKRDGSRQEFNDKKIFSAVSKANSKVEKEKRLTEEQISKVVETTLKFLPKKEDVVSVELIHESVENALMKLNFFDTAKQYIRYREDRDRERFKKYTIIKEMEEKLAASNVQNQNANLDEESFGGRKGEMDSAFLKDYALNYCIKPKFARNHKNNRIYIHDLDSYTIGQHNCLSCPIDELLEEGFKTKQVDIRPAGSVNTAFQLLAVIFQLQSLQQFGGVAATHLDWTMVPYVRKSFFKHFKDGLKYVEEKSDKEIKEIEKNLLEKD